MKLSFFHNINTKLCCAGGICLIAVSASCGTGTASKSSDNSIQIGMDSIMVCDSITDQSGIKVTASFSATFPSSFKNSKKEAGKLLSTINSAIFNTTDANMPDVAKKTAGVWPPTRPQQQIPLMNHSRMKPRQSQISASVWRSVPFITISTFCAW